MSLDKFIDGCLEALLILLLLFCVIIFFAGAFVIFFDNKKCVAYSEPYQKKGFIIVGKVMVPTTYTSKDCVVWEAK